MLHKHICISIVKYFGSTLNYLQIAYKDVHQKSSAIWIILALHTWLHSRRNVLIMLAPGPTGK